MIDWPEQCWEWQGARNEKGYGRVTRSRYAHRIAYELATGQPVPDDMVVCHECDNPPCCNPSHLWLGSQAENLADMRAKGRWRGRMKMQH